jgi:hypothetical protein
VAPGQIVAGFTTTVGVGSTVRTEVLDPVQPAAVPVTVYVTLEEGLAVTTEPLVLLKPVAGLQVYVPAPLAVKVALPPEQMVAELTLTVGLGVMVTVEVFASVQPLVVPVTVYVVDEPGVAVTVEPVVALSPVEGVHE